MIVDRACMLDVAHDLDAAPGAVPCVCCVMLDYACTLH